MPDDGGMSEASDDAFRNYRKQQWIFRPVQQTVLFFYALPRSVGSRAEGSFYDDGLPKVSGRRRE
jgi:hypothetical protein